MGLPKFLVNHIRDVQTHSLPNAALHPGANNLPLIVFSHGLGGMKTQNSIQAEELASRGYVVIAADHAFDAFLTLFDDGTTADYRSSGRGITTEEFWAARGPQLATRTADVVFMLGRDSCRTKMAASVPTYCQPKPAVAACGSQPYWRALAILGGATEYYGLGQRPTYSRCGGVGWLDGAGTGVGHRPWSRETDSLLGPGKLGRTVELRETRAL